MALLFSVAKRALRPPRPPATSFARLRSFHHWTTGVSGPAPTRFLSLGRERRSCWPGAAAAYRVRWISASPSPRREPSQRGGPERRGNKRGGDDEEKKSSGSWLGGGGGAGAVGLLAILMGKGKWVLAATKLTKLSSLGSMFISIGTYSLFYGWPYACGIVALMYVHEAGHALAMVQKGLRVESIMFVPFMGAAVAMKDKPKSAYVDAYVSLAGPVVGTAGALVPLAYATATGSQLAFLLADFGFMINLLNLAPIGMLDGGRIAPVIHPNLVYLGLAGGATYMYLVPTFHPVFVLVLLSGAYHAYKQFTGAAEELGPISPSERLFIIAGYFGLIAFLLLALYQTGKYKKDASHLRLMQRPVELTVTPDGQIVQVFHRRVRSERQRAQITQLVEEIEKSKALSGSLLTVRDDGAGGLDFEIPTDLRSFGLPTGTKISYKKGGSLEVRAPRGKCDRYELQSSLSDALRIPISCLEDSYDGFENADSDEFESHGFKINMRALEMESQTIYNFWNEKVFFIAEAHFKNVLQLRAQRSESGQRTGNDDDPDNPSAPGSHVIV